MRGKAERVRHLIYLPRHSAVPRILQMSALSFSPPDDLHFVPLFDGFFVGWLWAYSIDELS